MLTLFPRIRPNPPQPAEPEGMAEVPVAQVTVTLESAEAAQILSLETAQPVPDESPQAVLDSLSDAPSLADSVSEEAPDLRPEAAFEAIPAQFSIFASALGEASAPEPPSVQASDDAPPLEAAVQTSAGEDSPAAQSEPAAEIAVDPQLSSAVEGESSIPATIAPGTIFDDLDVVHEASVSSADPESSASELLEVLPAAAEELPTEANVEPVAASLAEPVVKPQIAAAPSRSGRPKGSFFVLPRVPEPEVMDDAAEIEAYTSAAAQAHLDAIDDTLVAHAQLLIKGRERGRALDIGTGPGQIVLKLGYQLTRWKFVGVDRSPAMIEKARAALETAPELAGRVEFSVADGNRLDFPDASFDLVVCNSVLHHFGEPKNLLSEIARLVKPDGAILLRDLRRPARMGSKLHVRKHGKHYQGEMRRLFEASVRAAYTEEELRALVASSPLRDVQIFRHQKTHIGFQRPLRTKASKPPRAF